jgi:hypothetical protein
MVEVLLIFFVGNHFMAFDPLVARWQGVDTPVNKKTKAIMGKPGSVCHFIFLL